MEGPRLEAPAGAGAAAKCRDRVLDYYIHGGLTKTGSTSIQQFLAANPQALADRGVFYPVGYLDLHNRQHSPLAGAIADGRVDEVARFANDSRDRARAAGAQKVIWSGESIGNMRADGIATLAQAVRTEGGADDVHVVIYFRNLYDRLVSRMNQQAKMREDVVDDAFIEKLNRGNPSDQIRAWEDVLGEDKVHIRIFDNAIRTGLEKDFLQVVGLEWSDDYVVPPMVNSSLDPITAQVLNLLRVEWGLPGGLVRNCERRSKNYRLPVLRGRAMELMHDTVANTDLSHPKLAPHKEVLTRFKAPDVATQPPMGEFIDDLIGTLTYIKEFTGRGQADGEPPRTFHGEGSKARARKALKKDRKGERQQED
jgi:hypothetical protein